MTFASLGMLPLLVATGSSDSLRVYELPQIEIEAVRLADPSARLPLASRRISKDAIEDRPGGSLRDVLLLVPGVRVASTGSPFASSASIRGSTFDQVLVLLDGRRLNSAQGGGVELSSIALDAIEDVTVFRGGASALWGPDALGGAIDVRTRRPQGKSARLQLGGGSFGEHFASGSAGAAFGAHWSARLGARFSEARADYDFDDDHRGTERRVRNGDLSRLGGELRLDGRAGGIWVAIDAEGLAAERGLPGSEEFPTPSARLDETLSSFGTRLRRKGSPFLSLLEVSYLRRDKSYDEPEAALGSIHETHRNDRVRSELALSRTLSSGEGRLVLGGSADRLESSTDGRRERRASDIRVELSNEIRQSFPKLLVMAAGRVDFVEGYTSRASPRIGFVAGIREALSLRASAGLSYRTPSFDELFWPPRASAAGNPELRPERGGDVDLGLAFERGRTRLALDGFAREIDDLIQWIPGASGVWRPHNVGSARIFGLEAEGNLELALPQRLRARLSASGTFLDARDETGERNVDGKQLVYRPKWTGGLEALFAREGFGEIEAGFRFVDQVYVTRANTKSLAGYAVTDLRARRSLASTLSLDLAVTNLTDVTARDFRDYPLPGRAWRAGLVWEMASR